MSTSQMLPAQSFASADLSPVIAAACRMLNWDDLGRDDSKCAIAGVETLERWPSSEGSMSLDENQSCVVRWPWETIHI